jgi:hypothetical protein
LFDETKHFIHAVIGNNCTRVRRVKINESLFKSRETKEVVLFFHMFNRTFVNRAVAVLEFVLGEVRLTRHAIEAAVLVEFDIAGIKTCLEKLFNSGSVTGLGRANEVVVRDVETFPCFFEERCNGIGELLRSRARSIGSLLDLQPVFVGACEEMDIISE